MFWECGQCGYSGIACCLKTWTSWTWNICFLGDEDLREVLKCLSWNLGFVGFGNVALVRVLGLCFGFGELGNSGILC